MSVLIFLIVLAVLILAHEFGHFIVAKKSGIRVTEFGLGFPPKLFGIVRGETEYTVNAIPFGGFVKIFGENPDEESLRGPDASRSFVHQSKWIQAAVIGAGVGCNFLLAWFLFSVGFMFGLPMSIDARPEGATIANERVLITGVRAGSPAFEAGLASGDAVRSVSYDNEMLTNPTAGSVQEFISRNGGNEITLVYERGAKEYTVNLTPEAGAIEDAPMIGIAMNTVGTVRLPFYRAFFEGGVMTVTLIGATIAAFGALIADAFRGTADIANLAGPVGIVSLVGDAANLGFVYVLSFVAFISINLGVLNLLPIPALDGGRLLFLAIEAVKGSPINYKIVNMIHAAGFVLLVMLLIFVTYNDVIRLFG